jgi:2-dehydropantoate 2-reductase
MSNVGPASPSVGRFAGLGPGGGGGLLAALLARSGSAVTCLAEASTTQAIATSGIRMESVQFADFLAPVVAAERLSEPVDVCPVTVKATQLAGALDRLPPDVVGSALIVPVLNGVEHVELLRQRYPDATVAAATIRVERRRNGRRQRRRGHRVVEQADLPDGARPPHHGGTGCGRRRPQALSGRPGGHGR